MQENIYSSTGMSVAQENSLIRTVYNWMMFGLFVSGFTAYFAAHNYALQRILFGNSITIWILLIGELGLVYAISGGARKMSASTASAMFFVFSLLNGLTISSIFLIYTAQSIAATFFVAGLTFGATSFYGYVTKTDLTSWGKYLMMGLIGIIIASVVNIFLHSSTVSWLVSYLGVFLFIGLTAYDTQKIREMGARIGNGDSELFGRIAIIGALSLYLDFINLFLMLLRIFGRGRD